MVNNCSRCQAHKQHFQESTSLCQWLESSLRPSALLLQHCCPPDARAPHHCSQRKRRSGPSTKRETMPGPSASGPRTSTSSTGVPARTVCDQCNLTFHAFEQTRRWRGADAIDRSRTALPRDPVAAFGDRWTTWEDYLGLVEVVTRPGFEQVLFVEMGWGADQHGQNATKACVRAARNAIEFTLCVNQMSRGAPPPAARS